MKYTLLALLLTCSASLLSQTFTNYYESDGLLSNTVLSTVVDQNDVVYFGTQNGISFYNGSTWGSYTETDGLVYNTVLTLLIHSEGSLWAGTDFGLSKYNGFEWTTYTTDNGLEDNKIKTLFESDNGNLWIGHADGASVFDGSEFTHYTSDDGLPFGGVRAIAEDASGKIWMGTALGGIHILDNGSFTVIDEDGDLISNAVRAITITEADMKWIATNEGISVFNSNDDFVMHHESIITLPEPHEINPVEDIKIDSQGRAWAGVYVDYLLTVGGVGVYDGGIWTDFDEDDGLAGPAVTQLSINSMDDVWVATTTGVTKISGVPLSVEVSEEVRLELFPNPASDFVTLVAEGPINELELMDAQGRAVALPLLSSTASRTTFGVSNLNAGLYLLRINNTTRRLIIQ